MESISMTWRRQPVRAYPLPAGFYARSYVPKDREAWIRLWRMGGLCVTEDDEAEYKTAVTDIVLLGFNPNEDTFMICNDKGVPMATISAFIHADGKNLGYGHIHMVSADPAVRGMGIGNAMLSLAMRRLYDAGCEKVELLTDDFRLPAVKSYLNHGFEPVLSGDGMVERWNAVYKKLGVPNPYDGYTRLSEAERLVVAAADKEKEALYALLSSLVKRESEIYEKADGTLSGNEANCQSLVAELYREVGLDTDVYSPMDIPGFKKHEAFLPGRNLEERPNVAGCWSGLSSKRRVMIMAHTDTVPVGDIRAWKEDPHGGAISDGWIHGRGAADDKSGIAAGLFAVKILKECGIRLHYDVVLSSYCDEEQGGCNGALASCLRYPSDVYLYYDHCDYILNDRACAGGGWTILLRHLGAPKTQIAFDAMELLVSMLRERIPMWRATFDPYPEFRGVGQPEEPFWLIHAQVGNAGDSAVGTGRISFYIRAMRTKEELTADLQDVLSEALPKLTKLGVEAELRSFSRYFPACLPKKTSAALSLFEQCVRDACRRPAVRRLHNNWSDLNIITAYGGGDALQFGAQPDFGTLHGIHGSDEAMGCAELMDMVRATLVFFLRYDQSI